MTTLSLHITNTTNSSNSADTSQQHANDINTMTDEQRSLLIIGFFNHNNNNHNRNRQSLFPPNATKSPAILPICILPIIISYLKQFFHQSTILSPTEEQYLLQLLPDNGTAPSLSTLLLRGSVHGFSAKAFHKQCDGKPHTVSIIRSTTDHVFGGYTPVEWQSDSDEDTGYIADPSLKSFIFLLRAQMQIYISGHDSAEMESEGG